MILDSQGLQTLKAVFFFYISKRKELKRKLPFALRLKYILSQKDSHAELTFLTTLIGGNVQKSKSGVDSLVINNISLDTIVNYFTNHPLKTKKLQSYEKWMEIRKMVQDKQHLSIKGMLNIKKKS